MINNTTIDSDKSFQDKIINIKPEVNLIKYLVNMILDETVTRPESIVDYTIFLPTKRSVRYFETEMIEALTINDKETILMPNVISISSLDEESVGFISGQIINGKKIIDDFERILLLSALIKGKTNIATKGNSNVAQMLKLAKSMASIIDDFTYNNVSFDEFKTAIQQTELTEHWKDMSTLLELALQVMPELMDLSMLFDRSKFEMELIKKLAEHWEHTPPKGKVVTAGIVGDTLIAKMLLRAVYNLSNNKGLILLQGYDHSCSKDEYQSDMTHHQYAMNEALCFIRKKEENNITIDKNSHKYQYSDIDYRKNICIVETESYEEEAMIIAIMLCEPIAVENNIALNHNTIKSMLVTSDFELARRVEANLSRFGVFANNSIGTPLTNTAAGVYIRLLAEWLVDSNSKEKALAFLKNPFCNLFKSNENPSIKSNNVTKDHFTAMRKKHLSFIRDIEMNFRMDRADPTNESKIISELLATKNAYDSSGDPNYHTTLKNILNSFLDEIEKYTDLLSVQQKGIDDFNRIVEIIKSVTDSVYSERITITNPKELPYIITFLLAQESVRPKYGATHTISILTPIEARLIKADRVIIAGMNDDSWPGKKTNNDFWMNREMRLKLGLPLEDKDIGVAQLDFINLCHANEVFITRSTRVGGAPTVKSRWLLQIESSLKKDGILKSYQRKWQQVSDYYKKLFDLVNNQIDDCGNNLGKFKFKRPEPSPPISSRPLELYATHIEKLLVDPYEVYVKKILNLYYLPMLTENKRHLEKGILFHRVMEEFLKNGDYSTDGFENIINRLLDSMDIAESTKRFWKVKLSGIATWAVPQIFELNKLGVVCYPEIRGSLTLANGVKVCAKADRIDVYAQKEENDHTVTNINIIDYKTGSIPTLTELVNFKKPQLLIEAYIAKEFGFKGIKGDVMSTVNNSNHYKISISCWGIRGKDPIIKEYEKLNIETIIHTVAEKLLHITNYFIKDPSAKYIAGVKDNSSTVDENPYKHLSRLQEWRRSA